MMYVTHDLPHLQGAGGQRAPGPLVHFDNDVHQPQWFREGIDGVQPVPGPDEFDLDSVCLECECAFEALTNFTRP